MTTDNSPPWLQWARKIQAVAQTGLAFSDTDYHVQRYRRLMEIAADILHRHAALPTQPVLENFMAQPGYATPKVDVRAAVLRDNKILLVQERSDRRWCLPGGWADVGDFPSETAEREVREESGFEVKTRKVLGVYDANRSGQPLAFYHAYKILFLCDLLGGAARPSDETLNVDFFAFDQLPPLSTERTHPRHLLEVQAHLSDPTRPAAFD